MILRLVYSFFFLSLVTGNKWGYYGYPPNGVVSISHPTHVETKSYNVEFLSDNDNQAPAPVQFVEEEKEKTICFTPRMVHRMVKAALEYVSQMPSDINNIINKIDQELNRMGDPESLEEHYVKKPLYPIDSRTIFQLLNKPRSETRSNLILKYELPSVQEPQCKEALEKLIKIAYNAYLELEQHLQCRDYLYRFASHQPEDQPKGHLEYGPDLKSIIASILEQIDKYKPKSAPEYNQPDYYNHEIDIPIPDIPIPQIHEITIPQIHEITIPQIHNLTKIREINIPQVHEINIPQIHEFNIPQIKEITIPQVHEINNPHMRETIHQTIHENKPLRPEETLDILIKLLKNNELHDNKTLFDRLMSVVEENQNNFHPQVFELLLTLLNAHKQKSIPRFDELIFLLLDSERNKQWPWSDNITKNIRSYLIPDKTGNVDSRKVDIILNLYNKPTNEKHIEYVLSLLKPIKDGILDDRVGDTILNLVNSYQNNLLHPEHIHILLKLLKPNNGVVDNKAVEIINHLSRWNEMGLSPYHLDVIFTLLKPDLNGNIDQRALDIIYFLLTQNNNLSPKHFDFILSFLHPGNGILDTRRIDIIHFILNNASVHPKHVNILISLLQDNALGVLNSRFFDVLLILNSNRLLTPEFFENVITLLNNEITGHLDDDQVKTFFFHLAALKQTNPKLVVDILTLLNHGGLHGNIVEWLETTSNNIGIPNRDSTSNLNVLKKVENLKEKFKNNHHHEYRTLDGGYQPENDFRSIFKSLDAQGLINPAEQGAPSNDLVNKLVNILKMGEHELGAVELTYMLKHEKPLVYQPVYYVKYRLPILSFISNMKSLLIENPQLTNDPMRLLQELIVVSNVTEVSPNLQGYPKEEILKLTHNDGDLVQAKILDEQNLNLNEQITYVHGLNTDISPEEILQLNRMNEAKYYPTVFKITGSQPETVTVHEIDKYVQFPTVSQHLERKLGRPHQAHTIQLLDTHHYQQPPQHIMNAQLHSPK